MSINAVEKVSALAQQIVQQPAPKPAPAVTPFSQQLDTQVAQGEHGHHHHAASQSVASSASAAASVSGVSPHGSVASSLMKLLG